MMIEKNKHLLCNMYIYKLLLEDIMFNIISLLKYLNIGLLTLFILHYFNVNVTI